MIWHQCIIMHPWTNNSLQVGWPHGKSSVLHLWARKDKGRTCSKWCTTSSKLKFKTAWKETWLTATLSQVACAHRDTAVLFHSSTPALESKETWPPMAHPKLNTMHLDAFETCKSKCISTKGHLAGPDQILWNSRMLRTRFLCLDLALSVQCK